MKTVDYPTAKALQELGYDGECAKTYTDFDTFTVDVTGLKIPSEIPAPRLDDVAYFLRDRHGIVAQITYADFYDPNEWYNILLNLADGRSLYCKLECFPTYDDALEAAVTEAIQIIKNRKL